MNLDEDDSQGRTFDILAKAMQLLASEGITKQEAVPVLVDFTTVFVLAVGGEAAAEAAVTHIRSRIADWKAGNFPVRSNDAH